MEMDSWTIMMNMERVNLFTFRLVRLSSRVEGLVV